MNDTKVAALFKPSTQRLHRKLEDQIITLLQAQNCTRAQLAWYIGKGVNCVTAPVKALLDAGIIVEHERVRNPHTGALNWALKLKED